MSFMNRMGNARNPYQTDAKKVLCLCSAGLLRSPTMANVLHQEWGYNTRAAGVSQEYALVQIDPVLIRWADEIVCVEKEVADQFKQRFAYELTAATKIVVLAVPDKYEWDAPELRAIIKKQYADKFIMEKAFGEETTN